MTRTVIRIPAHLAHYPWYEPHQRWLRGEEGGVRAWLPGARLTDANLADANLTRAYLTGADLTGADLTFADLTRAYLTGANLADANLTGATGIIDAGTPNGWRVVGWLRVGWLSVRVSCHDMRLHEAREYWCETHPQWAHRQEIPPALDYIESIARLRGWRMEESS